MMTYEPFFDRFLRPALETTLFHVFYPILPPFFPFPSPFFTQKIVIFPKNLDLPAEPALLRFHLRTAYFPSFPPPDPHPHPGNCHLSPKKHFQVISLSSYFFNKNTSPQESPDFPPAHPKTPIFPLKPHKTQKNHQKTSPSPYPIPYHFYPKTSSSKGNPAKPPFFMKNLRFSPISHQNPGKPLKPLSKHLSTRLFETPIIPFTSPFYPLLENCAFHQIAGSSLQKTPIFYTPHITP